MASGDCANTSSFEKELKEKAIVVQHDWFQCISADPFKFFVGIREFGCKTEFFDCSLNKGSVEISENKREMEVKISGKTVCVTVPSLTSTIFVSPVAEYGGIHSSPITSVDVSSSGNMLLTTDSMGKLKISSTMDGRPLRELEGHILSLYSTYFFPSGLVVLSGGMDLSLRVWSVETAEAVRVLKGHKMAVTDCAVIGVGKDVLSCSKDGTVKKWNCGRGECDVTWTPEAGECNCLALNGDNKMIAVGCSLNKTLVYNLVSDKQISSLSTPESVSSVAFSPSLDALVVGDENGRITVYDLTREIRIASLLTSRGKVEKLMWRLEGIYAAFHDGTMCCFNSELNNSHPRVEYSGGDCDPIYSFSFYENTLFTACRDKVVRKYRVHGN